MELWAVLLLVIVGFWLFDFARAYKAASGNVSQRALIVVKKAIVPNLVKLAVLFVLSLVLNFVTNQYGWHGAIAAAVIIGAAITINWFLTRTPTPTRVDPFPNATPDFRALMPALVAAAEYQSCLDDHKVSLIASILHRVYGKDYELATIATACRALSGEGEVLTGYLFDAAGELPLEFRRTIVRESATVLVQGSRLTAAQEEFLLYMSRALRLPDEELASNLADMRHLAAGTPPHSEMQAPSL